MAIVNDSTKETEDLSSSNPLKELNHFLVKPVNLEPFKQIIDLQTILNEWRETQEKYYEFISGFPKIHELCPQQIYKSIEQFNDSLKFFNNWLMNWEKYREDIKHQLKVGKQLEAIGRYGWTAIPDTYFESYLDVPLNQDSVDDFFLKQLDEQTIKLLFDEVLAKTEQNDDIREAIDDYTDKRYKSCALLLFGILDAILIENQNPSIWKPNIKNPKRPSGFIAAKNMHEFFSTNLPANFHYYHRCGLISCLEKVFESANDFRDEGPVINRNYISHGMSNRCVTKKDCLQLFLLLRNFISFVFDLNDKLYNE